MTLWKEGDKWRYRFQMYGDRHGKSGFRTKREAAEEEAAHRRRLKKQAQTPAVTDFRLIASEYLDLAERKFAKKTYKQKAFVLKSFLAHTGNLPIEDITASHLHSYLNTRPTNNNYNAHRKDLCAVFTFAKRVKRVIRYNPCWDLDKMPHTPDEKYIPPEEDILKLIMVADPATDERDLILTLIHTAARVDEILRLKWQDVNLTKRTMTRWTRKRKGGTYEPIKIHMNNEFYSIMKKRWENRESETWVYYNEKTGDRFYHRPKLMKGLCKRAGIDPAFGFHNIRHFVASYLADAEKISKKAIGGLLGHKALQTTEIYLHSSDKSETEALDRLAQRFGGFNSG
ncbi:MAG TPA: site-specific integrase [Desulfobacteraceae bacterium]|nr:site-specific integrase [Desulfobacteraceae bacterium]